MSDQMPPRIRVAALVTVLVDALEHKETRHLANDRFMADLRGIRARAEGELETLSRRRRLRIAEEPGDSAADD